MRSKFSRFHCSKHCTMITATKTGGTCSLQGVLHYKVSCNLPHNGSTKLRDKLQAKLPSLTGPLVQQEWWTCKLYVPAIICEQFNRSPILVDQGAVTEGQGKVETAMKNSAKKSSKECEEPYRRMSYCPCSRQFCECWVVIGWKKIFCIILCYLNT